MNTNTFEEAWAAVATAIVGGGVVTNDAMRAVVKEDYMKAMRLFKDLLHPLIFNPNSVVAAEFDVLISLLGVYVLNYANGTAFEWGKHICAMKAAAAAEIAEHTDETALRQLVVAVVAGVCGHGAIKHGQRWPRCDSSRATMSAAPLSANSERIARDLSALVLTLIDMYRKPGFVDALVANGPRIALLAMKLQSSASTEQTRIIRDAGLDAVSAIARVRSESMLVATALMDLDFLLATLIPR
jgi:hypothetical protein